MRRLATATLSRLLPLPIVFALLFAPLQSASDTAYACSCIETTLEERVQSADVVAIGTVVSLYEDETIDGLGGGMLVDTDGVFAIDTYYKGSGPSEIAVDDPPDGGTCGFVSGDSIGQEAVLFLELRDGEYLTHLCAGTRIFYSTDDVLAGTIAGIEAITGPGVPPDDVTPEDEHTVSTPWAVVLPLAFAIPLAVLVIPAFLRRRGGH